MEILADLNWFDNFMLRYNGRNIIPSHEIHATIYVDSCLVGAAGICRNECYMYKYPAKVSAGFHITQLEALNCLMAVRTFTSKMAHKVVKINCDNLAAVTVFRNSRGRDMVLNAIARALWFHAAKRDLDLRFEHMPGERLPVVDTLSRAYIDESTMDMARTVVKSINLILVPMYPARHNFNQYL